MSSRRYTCGVPMLQCNGTKFKMLSFGIRYLDSQRKVHSSRVEAFRCRRRWLMAQGWVPIGPREFSRGPGEPVMVLSKKSKFGGVLRAGKGVDDGGSIRLMPSKRPGGLIAAY